MSFPSLPALLSLFSLSSLLPSPFLLSFFVCVCVCVLCAHVTMRDFGMHGGQRMTLSVPLYPLCLTPLRQGLSLDLVLDWQPADCSDYPVSSNPHRQNGTQMAISGFPMTGLLKSLSLCSKYHSLATEPPTQPLSCKAVLISLAICVQFISSSAG